MSETELIAEVSVTVKVPADLKKVIEELCYLELKGDKLKLYVVSDITREALLKGLRLMMLERKAFDRLIGKEAKNGAKRIHTSLSQRVYEAQVNTRVREALEQNEVRNMEEEKKEEPEEEEEEKDE